MSNADYVIIGGGSAGSALAGRLPLDGTVLVVSGGNVDAERFRAVLA